MIFKFFIDIILWSILHKYMYAEKIIIFQVKFNLLIVVFLGLLRSNSNRLWYTSIYIYSYFDLFDIVLFLIGLYSNYKTDLYVLIHFDFSVFFLHKPFTKSVSTFWIIPYDINIVTCTMFKLYNLFGFLLVVVVACK